jgi:cytochrome o ubiquinol oxidase operon protein cyoD
MSHHSDQELATASSIKSYLIGFIASLALTVIPFAAVMGGTLDRSSAIILVALFACIQIIVQVYFFLHLDASKRERWNVLSLVFTLVIVAIVLVGSLWVMYNLHINMLH